MLIRTAVVAFVAALVLAPAAFAKGSCKDADQSSAEYCQSDAKTVKNFRSGTVGDFVSVSDDKVVVKVDGKTRMWALKSTSRAQ